MKIAETLYKQKSYTEAANKYLEVIPRILLISLPMKNWAKLLYYAKQYPNAAFYLSKYLTFDHNNSKAYQYDANAFFLAHDYEEAAKEAKEGLQYFPQLNELKRIVALSFIYLKSRMTPFNTLLLHLIHFFQQRILSDRGTIKE